MKHKFAIFVAMLQISCTLEVVFLLGLGLAQENLRNSEKKQLHFQILYRK